MESLCNRDVNCSYHGRCVDIVQVSEEVSVPLITQSNGFVAPKFAQSTDCLCDQGYDGVRCETLVNACGRRPCSEFEECIPSKTLSRGYSCQCPNGKAGPSCRIDLSLCQKPSCHYPVRPLSFKGKSYAQYSMPKPLESSSLQVSASFRTRHPVGIIFYASGEVDYSILEVSGGHVQYRWDCGSGEGLVRVAHLRVDDDKWHFVNLTRDRTVSKLTVDDKTSTGAAPGVHDILNMDSGNMYVGAKVEPYAASAGTNSRIEFGFVGCLDTLIMNGFNLPVDVSNISPEGKFSLKRLANVELKCPETLSAPGICGSHPCLNGGSCNELGNKYSCACLPRFTGKQCQIDTAPCSSFPCLNGGKCKVVGHNYICRCPTKLSGKRCEYGVYCNPNPCKNGGRCEEGTEGAVCKCQHFTGASCEMDIDECIRNPCLNGGTCVNLYGGFRCLCLSNFTGEYCSDHFQKHHPGSSFFLSFKELLCFLAIILVCIIIILIVAAWQRKRWSQKRHQQNNRVKLTGHHVKNDLKTNDVLKRNSKICNVEADQQLQQQGPLLPRPNSYTPSGTADSVLLHTLKQLADLSVTEHDALELSSLTRRRSNDYVHNLKNPATAIASSPSAADTKKRKPWDHHNNLNETYFTPSKEVGFDLPPNLEEDPEEASPQGLNTSFSDNSSVPNHHKDRVYHWDDYDLRGSTSMLTFSPPAGAAERKEDLSSSSALASDPQEEDPLIEEDPTPAAPSSPVHHREGIDAPSASSFEDVLAQNDISNESPLCPPKRPVRFNIEKEEKISNIPPPVEDAPQEKENIRLPNNLGSPRSRRPFVRSDFGRASDVSFLSTLEEEGDRNVSESESYL